MLPFHLSSVDICIILSNLLENALKACAKVKNIRDRKLAIFSTVKDGKFYLSVSNSYEGEVEIVDGIPQTEADGHGMGVNSIASIVKNNNGTFLYEAENGIFTFKMIN
ncbi:MAG: GHKL domain-containing protein [Acutalibacteraceae bacterium]|jgi:two-component system sensor histidine kinase AgrC